MWAYVVLIIVIIGLWFLFDRLKMEKKKKKILYCIICGILLVLVAGTRVGSLDFGDDSMYMRNFTYVRENSFVDVFNYFKAQDTEVVFYEFTKLVSLFTDNYNVLLTICAIPIVFVISRIIYKFSKKPYFSYLIFFCAFFFLWSMVTLGQAIAMAFVGLSLEFLLKKKYWRFLIAVGCAVLFHRTAIVFLLALPLSFLRYSKKSVVGFIALCIIGIIFGEQIVNMAMGAFADAGHFSAYLDRAESFGNWKQIYKFLVYGLLTASALVVSKDKYKTKNSLFIHSCLVGCLLCTFAPFFAETYRLALYFMLSLIIILPNAVDGMKDKKMQALLTAVITVSLIVLGFVTFASMGYQNIIMG